MCTHFSLPVPYILLSASKCPYLLFALVPYTKFKLVHICRLGIHFRLSPLDKYLAFSGHIPCTGDLSI